MTITALTCPATSADLLPYHPRIFDAVSPAQRDYATQISLAFTQLLNDLLNSGFDAARLPNSAANIAAMKPLVCHKALSIIFLDLVKESGDKWHVLYQAHEKQYSLSLSSARLSYDNDDDGTVDDDTETDFSAPLRLTR